MKDSPLMEYLYEDVRTLHEAFLRGMRVSSTYTITYTVNRALIPICGHLKICPIMDIGVVILGGNLPRSSVLINEHCMLSPAIHPYIHPSIHTYRQTDLALQTNAF